MSCASRGQLSSNTHELHNLGMQYSEYLRAALGRQCRYNEVKNLLPERSSMLCFGSFMINLTRIIVTPHSRKEYGQLEIQKVVNCPRHHCPTLSNELL